VTDGMTTVPRRFSHSLVSTYLDCPRKAWFRYVETIPSPPAPALIIGSACDEAWNYALQTKLEIETDLGPCMVQDVAEQAFRDRVHAEGGVDAIDWGEDGSARKSLDSALRLLSYRPRSEQELRDRLARKAFGRRVIEDTLRRLRELGYVDDAAFARFWTETRQAQRPRSRRLLTGELRRRGVAQEQAEEATADISDEEAAYQAASRRLSASGGKHLAPGRGFAP